MPRSAPPPDPAPAPASPLLIALAIAVSALTLALSTPLHAETLTLTSGRTLTGTILSRTDTHLTLRQHQGGLTIDTKLKLTDITNLSTLTPATQPAGTPYARIPLTGAFGREITADTFAKSLAAAKATGATVILLHIDSPGGSVQEMAKILDLIHANTDGEGGLHFIAIVKNAISAAAITAMACRDIVMLPDSNLGAAVAFQVGPDGTPQLIEEKFASVIRSFMRQAATLGHHDPLWVRAMTEPELQLYLLPNGQLSETDSGGGKLIKPKSRILTLTDHEAVDYHLATGSAVSLADVRTLLHIDKWYEPSTAPWQIAQSAASDYLTNLEKQKQLVTDYAAGKTALAALKQKTEAASKAYLALKAQRDAECEAAARQSQTEHASAQYSPHPDEAQAAADAVAKRRLADIDTKYSADLTRLRIAANDAITEYNRQVETLNALAKESATTR